PLARQTEPSSKCLTPSSRAMAERLRFLSGKYERVLCAPMTFMLASRARLAVISSCMPTVKNVASFSGLRFSNGSTAMERSAWETDLARWWKNIARAMARATRDDPAVTKKKRLRLKYARGSKRKQQRCTAASNSREDCGRLPVSTANIDFKSEITDVGTWAFFSC